MLNPVFYPAEVRKGAAPLRKSEISFRKNRSNITFPKLFFWEIFGETVNECNDVKTEQIYFS
jgi:hypothetical protein